MINDNDNDNDKSINDELVKNIQVRLRKIEGQVKGIEKMVTSQASYKDILVQVAAARAAMNKVGGLVLEKYTKNCFLHEDDISKEEKNEEEAKIKELISTFFMFLK